MSRTLPFLYQSSEAEVEANVPADSLNHHLVTKVTSAYPCRRNRVSWYVLTRRQPYHHFSHERIAYKYLTWAWQMDEAARDGLTRQQFARYYLMRLGIGHDLTRIAINPKYPRKLASEAELVALRPELNRIE